MLELVRECHIAFGHPVSEQPHLTDDTLNDLRVDLLLEETGELELALKERDPVAVLDALADIQYVLDGAWLALGFAKYKEAAVREVHRANMSKLENGKPVLRADGKFLKGRFYKPPVLDAILAE